MSTILLGKGSNKQYLQLKMLNRHGIISGATGSGKTITLKVIAEQLSKQGIPVVLSDIKGDLSSIIKPGESNEKIATRVTALEIEDFEFSSFPSQFLDVFGENGVNIRSTISEMGPIMLTRLLGLNATQSGVLTIAFEVADQNGWLLEDLKDLRALLNYISDYSSELKTHYGNISSSSVGAILRSLLVIEQQGGNYFFGQPSFDVQDLLNTQNGQGVINVLSSAKLVQYPQLYATFLFWLLSELYENLDEVGDLEKPRLVFFFDEAHILFNNDNKILLEKVELLVRLIRSKGVGIFFVTQNPTDIPESISSQLGTRIQHTLRAFTPNELKKIKTIADAFRSDNTFNVEETITSLEVGEALVSTLDEKGVPTFAKKITVRPPESYMGVASQQEILYNVNHSPLYDKYSDAVDSFSAYEALLQLQEQPVQSQQDVSPKQPQEQSQNQGGGLFGLLGNIFGGNSSRRSDSTIDRFTKNIASSVGREIGKQITRGIFGTKK